MACARKATAVMATATVITMRNTSSDMLKAPYKEECLARESFIRR
jgi:hypothetical protein